VGVNRSAFTSAQRGTKLGGRGEDSALERIDVTSSSEGLISVYTV
jgi:hypothetical protein